jgi:hypothetical protein
MVLLAVMAVLQITTALRECQSYDEHIHLAAGYAVWKASAYWLDMEHPALARLIAAAPLLALNPTLPTESRAWKEMRQHEFGVEFLYHNRYSPDRILFLGRLPMMALALLFGALVAWWVRRYFGVAAALSTTVLYCLDPNFIAHSRYVTTDVPLATLFFLACMAAVRYLEDPRWRHLVLASVLLGLALATKYSAFVLLPIFALLYGIRWWQRPRDFPARRLPLVCAALMGIALVVILMVYWPDTLRCIRGGAQSFAKWGDHETAVGRTLGWMGKWLYLPTHTYPFGLQLVADHNRVGHGNYLLGETSRLGWWYYFPVAFLVKSTLAMLIALAVALLVGLCGLRPGKFREMQPVWCGLILPPLVFFAASMTSAINIGVRHILPVYPFICVLAGVALTRVPWRLGPYLLTGVLALQAVECAAIYPDYLAFFNVVAGGASNGPRYLVDSNIDWGQDLKKLARWLEARGTHRVYLRYFGGDQPAYERLDCLPVPVTADQAGREAVDGFVAVSVTFLQGAYVPRTEFAWLRERTPAAKVGYSIYVYDLRKHP